MAGYGAIFNDLYSGLGGDPAGKYTPEVPHVGGVARQYRQLLNAYAQGMPTVYNTEATYKPQFTALDLSNLQSVLQGVGASPGLLEQFGGATRSAGATTAAANTASRTANVADFTRLGPEALTALKTANPQLSGLMDLLTKQAGEGLSAGATLDPSLATVAQQTIRGGQAARGLGYGPADVLQESRALTSMGDQLRQERQGFAQSVAGLNQAYQTPVLNLLTGESSAPATGASLLGAGQGVNQSAGPTLINPQQQYDMLNTPYNAQAAANIAGANNLAASDNAY